MSEEQSFNEKWRRWAENTTPMAEALAAPEIATPPKAKDDLPRAEAYEPSLEELWNPKPF